LTIFLQRTTRFQAGVGGRLNPARSRALRGGHTYTCSVMVSGRIDPATGIVVNIKDIDLLLKRHIVADFDGSILDADLPEFKDSLPTLENITLAIWSRLVDRMPDSTRLEDVLVAESPIHQASVSRKHRNIGAMLTTTRTYDFSASHRLNATALTPEENQALFGKCNWENGHGHNYEVEVTVAGDPDAKSGELVPADTIDIIVDQEVLIPYDHKHLNYDTVDFKSLNPTSENVTKVIWDKLAPRINAIEPGRLRLHRVAVRETPRNYFEYFGE